MTKSKGKGLDWRVIRSPQQIQRGGDIEAHREQGRVDLVPAACPGMRDSLAQTHSGRAGSSSMRLPSLCLHCSEPDLMGLGGGRLGEKA